MKHKYFFKDKSSQPHNHHVNTDNIYHCIDVFQTITPEQEWLTVIDSSNRPFLINSAMREELPEHIRKELAINELMSSGPSRMLKCAPIYLFSLDSIDTNINTPGVNDPVYLKGELIGPYMTESDQPITRQKGRLLSCRADILEAFLQSFTYSFHYSSETNSNRSPKMHNLLLAIGDNDVLDDLIYVLVYPSHIHWTNTTSPGNEKTIKSITFNLLKAIQADLEQEGIANALKNCTIPIPDLETYKLEQQLDGSLVTDSFIKPPPPENASWLKRIFHSMFSEKTSLPQEGDLYSFACLTQKTVKNLPEWPSAKEKWLKRQVIHWLVYWGADLAFGISPVKNADGFYEYLNGTLVNIRTKKHPYSYLYFDIDDEFAADISGPTEISLEYFDSGLYEIKLEYCAEHTPYKPAKPYRCPRHGKWHWATFSIPDGIFNNSQKNGADFRISLGCQDHIKLRQIKIRKFHSKTKL